jgi:hypothetical protein
LGIASKLRVKFGASFAIQFNQLLGLRKMSNFDDWFEDFGLASCRTKSCKMDRQVDTVAILRKESDDNPGRAKLMSEFSALLV